MRVVLTRPKELVSRMAQSLYALGAEVIELPSICLEPYEENAPLKDALQNIDSYHWVAFTSAAGVRFFFDFLQKNRVDLRKLSHLRFAVIGSGTQKELASHGIFADFVPERYYAADLAQGLVKLVQPGQRVLLPRAKIGSKELTAILQEHQIDFTDIALYDTIYASHNTDAVQKLVEKGEISCATFTSASTVHGFVHSMEGVDLSALTAVCIGEKTAQAAESYGMKTIVSKEATIDSLTQCLVEAADTLRLHPLEK